MHLPGAIYCANCQALQLLTDRKAKKRGLFTPSVAIGQQNRAKTPVFLMVY